MTVHLNYNKLLNSLEATDASFRYIVHCIYADYLELGDKESYKKVLLLAAKFKLSEKQIIAIYANPFMQKQIIFEL